MDAVMAREYTKTCLFVHVMLIIICLGLYDLIFYMS